jgi:hypothetical protein
MGTMGTMKKKRRREAAEGKGRGNTCMGRITRMGKGWKTSEARGEEVCNRS